MKTLGWLLALSLLAVLLAAVLRYSPGYVLVVVPPYRVELSVGLAITVTAGLFALGYLLLRAGSRLAALPGEVRAWRARGQRERGGAALAAAINAYLGGRFGKARAHAIEALSAGTAPAVSAIIAARAAHELRLPEDRDRLAGVAASHDADDPTARLMAQAEWLAADGRLAEALDLLGTLPAPHTAALRLELRLRVQLAQWDAAARLVDRLAERKALSAVDRNQYERHVASEGLKARAVDRDSAREAWQQLPERLRADRVVALTAARLLAQYGDAAAARPIIERALDEQWDSALALQYSEDVTSGAPAAASAPTGAAEHVPAAGRPAADDDLARRIERCEAWLARQPNDAMLLLSLGRLCDRAGDAIRAQGYLEASLSIEPTHAAHLALARLHESLNHQEAAARHREQALALALRALDLATGGRRRLSP